MHPIQHPLKVSFIEALAFSLYWAYLALSMSCYVAFSSNMNYFSYVWKRWVWIRLVYSLNDLDGGDHILIVCRILIQVGSVRTQPNPTKNISAQTCGKQLQILTNIKVGKVTIVPPSFSCEIWSLCQLYKINLMAKNKITNAKK